MAAKAKVEADDETITSRLLKTLKEDDRGKSETGREFIMRLCRTASKLPDKIYEDQDNDVLEWLHDAIEAIRDRDWKAIPKLDGVSALEDDEPPARTKSADDDEPRRTSRPRVEDDDPPPRSRREEPEEPRRSRTVETAEDEPRRRREEPEEPRSRSRVEDEPRRTSRPRVEDDDPPPRSRREEPAEEPRRRPRVEDDDPPPRRKAADDEYDEPRRSRADPPAEKPAKVAKEPRKPPGRPRGTGLMYEVAEMVLLHPEWSENKIFNTLDEKRIVYKKDDQVTSAIRTAQNFLDILRRNKLYIEP